MVPYELLDWCQAWSRPRLVTTLSGVSIAQVNCGDAHTAILSTGGQLLLAGSGVVVPPISSNIRDDTGADDDNDNGDADMTKLVDMTDTQLLNHLHHSHVDVNTFRTPSSTWLSPLSSKRIARIYGGAGRMLVIALDDSIGYNLTRELLLHSEGKTTTSTTTDHPTDGHNDADNISDNSTSNSKDAVDKAKEQERMMMSSASTFLSNTELFHLLDKRGHTDCMIIAGGQVFRFPLTFIYCMCIIIKLKNTYIYTYIICIYM